MEMNRMFGIEYQKFGCKIVFKVPQKKENNEKKSIIIAMTRARDLN